MSKKTSSWLISLGAAALFVLSGSGADAAEQCRDANGRFMKCPTPAAPARCRDVTTKKFVKCGAPHSEAVPTAGGK